jgi:hypothetical protein
LSYIQLGYFGKYQKSRKAIDIQLLAPPPYVTISIYDRQSPISKHKRSRSNLDEDDYKTPKSTKSNRQPISHVKYAAESQKELYRFPEVCSRKVFDQEPYTYLSYQFSHLVVN